MKIKPQDLYFHKIRISGSSVCLYDTTGVLLSVKSENF